MLTIENPEKWTKMRIFIEFILKKEVKYEKVDDILLETFNKLTSELLEKTKRCQCNCINFNEHEELEKEEQELITLRKLMKWETW